VPNSVTIEGFTFDLPWLHFGVMGKPGTGKSRLIASMPKPLLVIGTDPATKMQPYFDVGELDPQEYTGPLGQEIRLVKDKDGKVLIQVEIFRDTDPTMVNAAMSKVVARIATLHQEVNAGMWKSVGIDSWSGLEDFASYRRLTGPLAVKQGGAFAAHRGVAKEDCAGLFLHTLIHLKCNLGIAFHTTQKQMEDSGEMTYNMKCIGDFALTVARNLADRYHSLSLPDGVTRQLRTRPDGRFELATLIDAPDPCDNSFGALFANMIAKKLAAAKAEAAKNAEK
jgi:hypothetical protein